MRLPIRALLASFAVMSACGGEPPASAPPERFRPVGFEVRVEGERMHAVTAEPDRCRELAPLVRESVSRTRLLSERVLVVGCSDRWLRMDIDVQSGDAEVTGGAPEVAAVVDAALWRIEHAEAHDAAKAASLNLARCTMDSTIGDVPDVLECIEARLPVGIRAFAELAPASPPEDDVCEWQRRSSFAEFARDAIRERRAPRRFQDSGSLYEVLERFDRNRYRAMFDEPMCTNEWHERFVAFDCVVVGQDGLPRFLDGGWRCTFERAAAALAHGYAPRPRER